MVKMLTIIHEVQRDDRSGDDITNSSTVYRLLARSEECKICYGQVTKYHSDQK